MTPPNVSLEARVRGIVEAFAYTWDAGAHDNVTVVFEKRILALLKEVRQEAIEECAEVADGEAVSEQGWAKRYLADGDTSNYIRAEGGCAACYDIAHDIRALKELEP